MITNEEAHLNALKAELAYVKAQPKVREDRVADIEAEIRQREPAPQVETTEAPETEKAVPDKPKRRQPKDENDA